MRAADRYRRTTRPEAAFQEKVLRLAEFTGWRLRYHTHDSRRSAEGFPDLALAKPGRLLLLELKVPPNMATIPQLAWVAATDGATCSSAVVTPADLATGGVLPRMLGAGP